MIIAGWDTPYLNFSMELRQLEEEGRVVPDGIRERFKMLHPEADAFAEGILDLWKEVESLPMREDWPYEEPDELEEPDILPPRERAVERLVVQLSAEEVIQLPFAAFDEQFADCWNDSLPFDAICTAETQAILNYNIRHPRRHRQGNVSATAAFTRRFNNPYREWIGAASIPPMTASAAVRSMVFPPRRSDMTTIWRLLIAWTSLIPL